MLLFLRGGARCGVNVRENRTLSLLGCGRSFQAGNNKNRTPTPLNNADQGGTFEWLLPR